jgi:hypothetical protein
MQQFQATARHPGEREKPCTHRGSRHDKQIRLNAFAMNCVAHQSPGL